MGLSSLFGRDDHTMGLIKAFLVGGGVNILRWDVAPLPLCKNDLYAMRTDLIKGLNVATENILMLFLGVCSFF